MTDEQEEKLATAFNIVLVAFHIPLSTVLSRRTESPIALRPTHSGELARRK